jgi:hypothetical protein
MWLLDRGISHSWASGLGNSNAAQLMPGPFVQRFVAWLVAVSLLADDFFDHGTQFLALAREFSHKFLETA